MLPGAFAVSVKELTTSVLSRLCVGSQLQLSVYPHLLFSSFANCHRTLRVCGDVMVYVRDEI
jgi:hypothetical protein